MNRKKIFLETKFLSYVTFATIMSVILCVYFSGVHSHRSLFLNSILSTSILAGIFFIFISSGLYFGVKLKENIGEIVNKQKLKDVAKKTPLFDTSGTDIPTAGDGIGGIILGVILWLFFTFVAVFLLYFLGVFFWSSALVFSGMLYWIFFRALRLVFKNVRFCKGNLFRSTTYGFLYSFLYISWIYGVIFLLHFLQHAEKVTTS